LFRTKSIESLLADSRETGEGSLKRTLGPWALVALGIGAIIGAGLFVRTAAAIADRAGPSVTLAFIVAGVGCAFAGLCYAEFASMIPVAGSAYTYSYATMGEFVAWIIGWDLVLEYAVGAATVAIAWSEYLNRLLEWFGLRIPYEWSHSPFEVMAQTGTRGMMNIPAVVILGILTAVLIRGTKESAFLNGIIVIVKVSIVLLVIGIGWGYINPANHTPMIPAATTYVTPEGVAHNYGGIMGILGRPASCSSRSSASMRCRPRAGGEESQARHADRHPGLARHLHDPLCPVLVRPQRRGDGRGFPVDGARGVRGLRDLEVHGRIRVALACGDGRDPGRILLGDPGDAAGSVAGVLSMSHDGLVPKVFSDVHPTYRTPYKSNVLFFGFTAIFGAFIPGDIVGEMTSIGTLFAFILVCAGVWIMRHKRPDIERGFTVPALPFVAIAGIWCAAR
jgi:APA family basic amino acid/polyamine antiporter